MNPTTRVAALCAAFLLAPATASALSLAQAEQALRLHNPDLRAAAIELRGSQGDALGAARRPAAELSLGSSKYSRREGIGAGRWQDKRLDTTAGLGWTWERGDKRTLRMRQADALLDAAGLDLLDSTRQQQLALHEAYYALKAAQELLQIAVQERDAATQGLAAADRQVASGAIAPVERARLAVDALKVADMAREAELHRSEAQHLLALLIGDADSSALQAEDDWPQLDAALPAAAALAQRADLRAAAARVRAAEAGLALARSERHRDVQFGIEAEREPADIGGVTWGLSMSVPLGGSKRWRGEAQRAEADRDASVLEQQRLHDQARAERDQLGHATAAAAARRADYERLQVPAAQQALDGLELAYRRGAASLTDLLDARRSWREFQTDLIDARIGHAAALARWQAVTATDSEGHQP